MITKSLIPRTLFENYHFDVKAYFTITKNNLCFTFDSNQKHSNTIDIKYAAY